MTNRRPPSWLIIGGSFVLAGAILLGAEFVSGAEHRQALPLMSAPSPAFGMVTSPGASSVASAPGVAGATVTSANPSQQTQQLLPNALPASPPAGTAIPSVPAMAESAPLRVEIPAIGVNASVEALGENPDGTVKVPSLSTPRLTSWFDDGPAPGQNGPAAIYGHVATAATGPAVFYRLADLVAGDRVEVARADHSVAVFRVYQVSEYAKDDFPTLAVYGDTAGPELRLVTCGGAFDRAKGSYDDNVVVYARLIAADH